MKKYLLGFLAVAIALCSVAFKSHVTTVQYHFIAGKALNQARVAGAYETFTSPPTDCDLGGGRPCIIQYNNTTYASLQAYLNTFATDAAVITASVESRTN